MNEEVIVTRECFLRTDRMVNILYNDLIGFLGKSVSMGQILSRWVTTIMVIAALVALYQALQPPEQRRQLGVHRWVVGQFKAGEEVDVKGDPASLDSRPRAEVDLVLPDPAEPARAIALPDRETLHVNEESASPDALPSEKPASQSVASHPGSLQENPTTEKSSSRYPDGTIIRIEIDNTYWHIERGSRRPFRTRTEMASYGFDLNNAVVVSPEDLARYAIGEAMQIRGGSLLRDLASGQLYLMQEGTLLPFDSAEVLIGSGYDLNAVRDMESGEIQNYDQGEIITQETNRFSDTKVMTDSSPVIYLLEMNHGQLIRRPIPSPGVFSSQGWRRWEDIVVISQQEMDGYPVGRQIDYRDGALIKGETSAEVFVVERSMRRPFATLQTLEELGYQREGIIDIPEAELATLPLGQVIE